MKKVLKKRTGFTLVELLIVIIIISILAGAMLLVAGSGTDKAEATKIVSNLRSLKAAAWLYYADKAGSGTVAKPNFTAASNDLAKYMDRQLDETSSYAVEYGTTSSSDWFVGYTGLSGKDGIKEKLKDVAKDSGLFKALDATEANVYDGASGSNSVYMKAR